ncbi:DNA polymerase alpha accessory factor Mcl1 [Coemansia sp. RSA 1200]|nr:DNA polymerase alpha accessory factor Mcl1 [Coemansia sp. RSA 1200]
MPGQVSDPRFAHAEGYTALAFWKNGQFVCTGGSDCLVRVFRASKSERDQDAVTLEQHSDNVLSLAVSKGKVISGDEEGMIFSFDLGTLPVDDEGGLSIEPSGTVLRSSLPARDISIGNGDRQVAIATDDESVRIVSLLDMALLHTLDDHRGAVNSVSFSPDSVYLASASCDGTVRVWDMRNGDPSCVHVMHNMAYVCEPGNNMEQFKVRWSPDGRFLAVPCPDHSIKLVERNSWEVSASLGGTHSKTVTHLAWSSNSRYIASIGLDNKVVVWDVAARKPILTHNSANDLCQVEWNPCGNMLAFTDNTGAMYIWDDVVPVDQGHVPPFDRKAVEQGGVSSKGKRRSGSDAGANGLMSDLFDDTAGVDAIENERMDEDSSAGRGNHSDIDEGDMFGDDGEEITDALDDFVIDDDGAGYVEHQPQKWFALGDQQTQSFQPGSTPWISDRRYLAFNMVGSVVSIAQDESHNTIEIEFYDKSLHRDIHFSDSFKFSMAALSEAGCLFATTSTEFANDQSLRGAVGKDEISVVSYKGFSSWSSNSDWMFKLPPKEHPRCIAASSHGAVVITSQGFVRFFTCGGAQKHILSLPHRTVTCIAHNDILLVILEAPGSIKSTHGSRRLEYEYVLYSMDDQSRLASGPCPVASSSEIVWAGFSEEGHPAICDSKGMLRILHQYWKTGSASWVPVLDSRKLAHDRGKRETFWPVGISAKQFIVAACHGKARFPSFPKPILDELEVAIPLLHTDTQVGQQEAKSLSERLFHEQLCGEAERTGNEYPGGSAAQARDELEQDKLLLRLVQLACKADKTQRAVDLALMIRLEKSFDAAIKIAVFQKQSSLAERLMRLKESKFATEDDYNDEFDMAIDGPTGTNGDIRRRTRPAATYGRKRNISVTTGEEEEREERDSGKEFSDAEGEVSSDERMLPPPLPMQKASLAGIGGAMSAMDGSDRLASMVAARPARPPATSKPFNPFAIASPEKSMAIKRSNSFFDAADAHSNKLSQDSLGSGASSASKRQQPDESNGDGLGADPAVRKQARKASSSNGGVSLKDRAQKSLPWISAKLASDSSKSGGDDSNTTTTDPPVEG